MSIDHLINKIHCCEALEFMKQMPDGCIDMILTDPPYGTTTCKWDSIIPLGPMWDQLKRLIKPNGAIVLTASQPFTTKLIASNMKMLKYTLVWAKTKVCHFAQAPYRFLTTHEDLAVFSFGGTAKNATNRMAYYPQGLKKCNRVGRGRSHSEHRPSSMKQKDYIQTKTGYPKSILYFDSCSDQFHPTQKPVALMEYLIKTYTNEGEIVLDFTIGSGTTAVACVKTGRDFIGIELDEEYCKIAEKRIQEEKDKYALFGE